MEQSKLLIQYANYLNKRHLEAAVRKSNVHAPQCLFFINCANMANIETYYLHWIFYGLFTSLYFSPFEGCERVDQLEMFWWKSQSQNIC